MNDDIEWMRSASCGGLGVDDFFFPEQGDHNSMIVTLARRICFACPVQLDCLRYAIENSIQHGIWGGFTVDERKLLLYGPKPSSPPLSKWVRSFMFDENDLDVRERQLGRGRWGGLELDGSRFGRFLPGGESDEYESEE